MRNLLDSSALMLIGAAIFIAMLYIILSDGCATTAHSQARRELTPDEQVLHLAVAKMCANEAFHSYGDCLLIYQATRRHGTTAAERLAWLHEHSNCVLVAVPPR